MIVGVADTHAALWHLFDDSRLSTAARHFIDKSAVAKQWIALSSISLVKIVEAMRLVPRDSVPDIPDRIVAAKAIYYKAPVISRDGRIHAANLQTVW